MDPNLFHLNWERTIEALVGIIVLSFLVERACALLFESRWWIRRFQDARVGKPLANGPNSGGAGKPEDDAKAGAKAAEAAAAQPDKVLPGRKYPLKEILGFLVALAVCWIWDFDAVSIILLSEHTQLVGVFVTAAIVAGGSKASIALFHNLLKIKSSAYEEKEALKKGKDK